MSQKLIRISNLFLCLILIGAGIVSAQSEKKRIFIVDSYSRDYLWSQSLQKGLCKAMLDSGYLDNEEQAAAFTRDDTVESSKAIVKKEWMDSKKKNNTLELAQATDRVMGSLKEFRPDLVLLGDDNAANYIGNQLLDTPMPVVFWGVNGLPLKYDLIDSMDKPGHNVTGVWQSGYYKESLDLLKKLVPGAKTFAILACDSETTRAKIKLVTAMDEDGSLPLKLTGTVATNSYEDFQEKAAALFGKVDTFLVLNHDTLKDRGGNPVSIMTAGKWYLENSKTPEASDEEQFVREGMLCAADDSAVKQASTAFMMGKDILEGRITPEMTKPVAPTRGPLLVNRARAEKLGIPQERVQEVA